MSGATTADTQQEDLGGGLSDLDVAVRVLAKFYASDVNGSADLVGLRRITNELMKGGALGLRNADDFITGVSDPGLLPEVSLDQFRRVVSSGRVLGLRRRMSRVSPRCDAILSGKHGPVPQPTLPARSDIFRKNAELVQGQIDAQFDMLDVMAVPSETVLSALPPEWTLRTDHDDAVVRRVERLAREALAMRRPPLMSSIADLLKVGFPKDWHRPGSWDLISLAQAMMTWRDSVVKDLTLIAAQNGSRGQTNPFVMPPIDVSRFEVRSWDNPPGALSRSSWMYGLKGTGASVGVGGTVNGASVGFFGKGVAGVYTAVSAKVLFSAFLAGGGLGGFLFLAFWFLRSLSKKGAKDAYLARMAELVTALENEVVENFMESFLEFYGRLTETDTLKYSYILSLKLSIAIDRMAARNKLDQFNTVDPASRTAA
ncbi:hypothetical protein J2X36_002718 [Methylobacterium sp. BE186]|uniref:hypothetical protein n=1 Tax=Methylobacterium sp. BE186 TaxID=2817715 RepID=UPI00285CDF18|nr:hypothetical protein [Methylobacterium sp. BE186]MDR7037963.1 hypothetical protein [Methylobacterium sp. BE186]